ncbi:MAG: PepSY domain-containing protein [Pararhodobacter sp.]|nr:PepSY domain-containing protein [Pararhodobacter sp.]
MIRIAALTCALAMASAPLMAQSAPPDGAIPLSQIVSQIEAAEGFRFVDEIEWDDDGYWEIEYVTTDGQEIKVRIDPMTGAIRR